jgi:hypothetical protein
MVNFKTTNGITYILDIKTKDIKAVKELVKYPDGKQVDIFEAAETGTLASIYKDIETLINVVFVLCLDQIKEHFDLKKYDENNQKTYEFIPELKDEPAITKASRWFGNTINGDSVIEIIDAFIEAVINFTPSESRRNAMRMILAKEKEIEKLEMDYRQKSINQMFTQTQNQLENRWTKLTANQQKALQNQLDGQFNSLLNTQE